MKSEILFALDNARWPALLIDRSGVVRRANQSAISVFGAIMEENFTQLSAIWSPENEVKADVALAKLDVNTTAAQHLKFRVKGGSTAAFSTCICPFQV